MCGNEADIFSEEEGKKCLAHETSARFLCTHKNRWYDEHFSLFVYSSQRRSGRSVDQHGGRVHAQKSNDDDHCTLLTQRHNYERGGVWWLIGRFVVFRTYNRRFESRSSHQVGTLGKFFTLSCLWRFGVKLRHSIPRAVSGAPLSSSGLEESL